ncbi:hypothetical protein HZB89_01460, partial [archaeon]|nr:hypothetical protein [archaeon]
AADCTFNQQSPSGLNSSKAYNYTTLKCTKTGTKTVRLTATGTDSKVKTLDLSINIK